MISTERIGRRTYLRGDTYPVRERLREAGAHWDPEQRAWWIGSHEAAESLCQQLMAASPQAQDKNAGPGEDAVVAGRARYRGRPCYVAGREVRGRTAWDDTVREVTSRDGSRILCYSMDGARQWWAAADAVEVQRRYERPQTIGGLRRFRERMMQHKNDDNYDDYDDDDACPNCGSRSCSAARGGMLCDED